MHNVIQAHNKKILNKMNNEVEEPKCNCRNECILPNKCRSKCVVYKATTQDNKKVEYIGSTSGDFKLRYNNHTASFKNEEKKHNTALSLYVWNNKLNQNNNNEYKKPNLQWEILKKCKIYIEGGHHCDLCISEKIYLLRNINNPSAINHRSDLGNKCIHKKQVTLAAIN